jgi:hypothetical protein
VKPAALLDALERVVTSHESGFWEDRPCLYAIHDAADGDPLRPLALPGGWPEGPPVDVLERVAYAKDGPARDALETAALPGVTGYAFCANVLNDGREERWIWALTRDGQHYAAVKIRGIPGAESAPVSSAPEPVRLALDWLTQAYTEVG